MNKIASLFLITALFYNVLGFYRIFAEQQEQVWVAAMEQTDDTNFEIIEVTINPYGYIVDSGFENANEDIVVDNKGYHVFKKRIQDNVLKFYCLRKVDEMFSTDLKKIVDTHLFDTNSNKENSNKKIIKSFIKDFLPTNSSISLAAVARNTFLVTSLSYHPKSALLTGYFTMNYPPPNMV